MREKEEREKEKGRHDGRTEKKERENGMRIVRGGSRRKGKGYLSLKCKRLSRASAALVSEEPETTTKTTTTARHFFPERGYKRDENERKREETRRRKRRRETRGWWRLAGKREEERKRVRGTEHEMRVPEFLPGDQ